MELPSVMPWEQDRIMEHLAPVVPIVHASLEAATTQTRLYIEGLVPPGEVRDDLSFHANSTRFHLNRALRARDQASTLDQHWLSNSGVAFTHGFTDNKVLKGEHGALPLPGSSRVKRAFFDQMPQLTMAMFEASDTNEGSKLAGVNVVWVWDVDADGALRELAAYSPRKVDIRGGRRWYWRQAILHPATTFIPELEDEEPGEDLGGYELPPATEEEDQQNP